MFKHCAAMAVVAYGLMSTPTYAVPFFHTQAIATDSYVTSVALRSERKKFSPELEHIRKRLISRRSVTFQQLRALADAGDSLAAFAYAKKLSGLGNPTLLSDALHYYAEAALGGRHYAARAILDIAARQNLNFNPAHLKQAERALVMLAEKGNLVAADGLIRFYSTGAPFGAKPKEISGLLERRVRNGDGEAAFRLAMAMLKTDQLSEERKAKVIHFFGNCCKKSLVRHTRISSKHPF
jgi:hypothetical protein